MSPKKQPETTTLEGNSRKPKSPSFRNIQATTARIEKLSRKAEKFKESAKKAEEEVQQLRENFNALQAKVKEVLEAKRKELDKTLSLFN